MLFHRKFFAFILIIAFFSMNLSAQRLLCSFVIYSLEDGQELFNGYCTFLFGSAEGFEADSIVNGVMEKFFEYVISDEGRKRFCLPEESLRHFKVGGLNFYQGFWGDNCEPSDFSDEIDVEIQGKLVKLNIETVALKSKEGIVGLCRKDYEEQWVSPLPLTRAILKREDWGEIKIEDDEDVVVFFCWVVFGQEKERKVFKPICWEEHCASLEGSVNFD